LLFVVAMADPLIPGPQCVVLIVDNGAGMNATDVKPTRLEAAKQAAARLIAGLRDCDRVAVFSAGEAVGVRCRPTNDLHVCQAAIEAIPPTDGAGNVAAAVELARRTIGDEPSARIVVISDGAFDGAETLGTADDIELALVGRPTGNAGITRFALRRNHDDPSRCQVLAEVASTNDTPTECRFDVLLDEQVLTTRPVVLAANGRWTQTLELTVPESGQLTARLDPADDYADDNTMVRDLPPSGAAEETSAFEALDAAATELRAGGEIGLAAESVPPLAGAAVRPWPYLLAIAVLLLGLEWSLYQRRWLS
ncbi:MAG TPA: VWA domain-containing protein, partial [Thermoguttaceae bacterium]|nr:VWA domain-containing protein [Thermoguttaceae bacterium]